MSVIFGLLLLLAPIFGPEPPADFTANSQPTVRPDVVVDTVIPVQGDAQGQWQVAYGTSPFDGRNLWAKHNSWPGWIRVSASPIMQCKLATAQLDAYDGRLWLMYGYDSYLHLDPWSCGRIYYAVGTPNSTYGFEASPISQAPMASDQRPGSFYFAFYQGQREVKAIFSGNYPNSPVWSRYKYATQWVWVFEEWWWSFPMRLPLVRGGGCGWEQCQ